MMLVIDQLFRRIDEKQAPLVVGLDPRLELIPSFIKKQSLQQYGNTKAAAADALFQFNREILAEIKDLIPAVKLQMACYEMFGVEGIQAFEQTVHLAHEYDLTVIDDSKRNDIGATAALYAEAHLGDQLLIEGTIPQDNSDFLTINPMLGSDTVQPFIEVANKNNKGIFALVRTSNPGAAELQEALIGGIPLYEKVAEMVQQFSSKFLGVNGFSGIGAVVGATWPEITQRLRQIMPNCFFLVPGFGQQGATADDTSYAFNEKGYGAIINSSRAIIFSYLNEESQSSKMGDNFAASARKATIIARDEILRSLKNANKTPSNW